MAGKVETVWKPEHKIMDPDTAFRVYQEHYCTQLSNWKPNEACLPKVAECGQILRDALIYKYHAPDKASWDVTKDGKAKYLACAKDALAR